jgi:hypothetical protein
VRRPVFIGDFSALERRQRILDEDALAEDWNPTFSRRISLRFVKVLVHAPTKAILSSAVAKPAPAKLSSAARANT